MTRRYVMIAAAVGVAVVVGIGLLVFANQQGWFGGRAHSLLTRAAQAEQDGQLPQAQASLEELIATFPDSPWADEALLKLGEVHEAQEQWLQAQTMYRTLLERFPDSPLVGLTQERLGRVNVALLFSPTVTASDAAYVVKPGDTLGKIASAHGTTIGFLKRANGLTGDLIHPGQKLKISQGRFTIVVDKSQNQLLLTRDNQFVTTYPVATGTDGSTPVGTFKVVNKVPDPVWYKQGAVVPPDSPENILGTRWLGLDKPGYGIHGSEDPSTIGQQVTAGCVRMVNRDVEEIFDLVPIGTEVTIVD